MKERILVALSGGVDSAVAAAILKTGGYDCVGVTMRLYGNDDSGIADAEAVAKKLGIEFHSVDMRKEFKELIVDSFVSDYENGLTPNPCVLCNRKIKFGLTSVATACIIVLIVVLLNGAVAALSDRFGLKVDLTHDNVYEFSQQTKDVLKNLDKNQ